MLFKQDGYKVNWIDKNDVYVGYDTSTSCCETADWFVSDVMVKTDAEFNAIEESPMFQLEVDFSPYTFDPSVAEVVDGVLDDGGIAIFRMVTDDGYESFLHLYNAHNGYYGHGFYSNTIIGDGGL